VGHAVNLGFQIEDLGFRGSHETSDHACKPSRLFWESPRSTTVDGSLDTLAAFNID
jgi:hypothetical protein